MTFINQTALDNNTGVQDVANSRFDSVVRPRRPPPSVPKQFVDLDTLEAVLAPTVASGSSKQTRDAISITPVLQDTASLPASPEDPILSLFDPLKNQRPPIAMAGFVAPLSFLNGRYVPVETPDSFRHESVVPSDCPLAPGASIFLSRDRTLHSWILWLCFGSGPSLGVLAYSNVAREERENSTAVVRTGSWLAIDCFGSYSPCAARAVLAS